jgi:hypothetical protein
MRARTPLIVSSVSLALVLAGCGASGNGTSGASATGDTAASTALSTPAGAVDPNAPEVVEPGDIPDDQVFVPYTSADGTLTVQVPEGWARSDDGGAVTFTDKYNSISITESTATAAPTVDSVTANGLADVSGDPTFHLIEVQPVTRSAGDGIVARYEIGSAPNDVTGKSALLAVERYVFADGGHQVTLTLAGAKGADNVDPWMTVSDSLTWN